MGDNFAERFWNRTQSSGSCWLWTGSVERNGYGRIKISGTKYSAHQVAYTLAKGAIPEGLHIDHLCRNRACINPDHLEAVTNKENRARGLLGAGLHHGEGNPRAKLTLGKVAEIKSLCGTIPQREIAKRFGVSQTTVTFINTGRNWACGEAV